MRTAPLHSYELDRETYEEQREGGRWNPARVIVWRGQRYTIEAGMADNVDVFTEGGALYVLARNRGMSYAGLEVFRDGERIADIFVDESERGDYLNELTPIYAAKRLANWADAEGGEAFGYDY